MMDFFNLRQPFFLPLFRRAGIVIATGGWTGLELYTGSPGWAMIFGSLAAYCTYEFFIIFDPEEYKDDTK